MKNLQKGFTLIELMIVIAIIGILAAILIPNFMRARAEAQAVTCERNEKHIATALEEYATDNNGKYSTNKTTMSNLRQVSGVTCGQATCTSVLYDQNRGLLGK